VGDPRTAQQGAAFTAANGIGRLWLFHHKPGRTDAEVQAIEVEARRIFGATSAAGEGMSFKVNGHRNKRAPGQQVVEGFLSIGPGSVRQNARSSSSFGKIPSTVDGRRGRDPMIPDSRPAVTLALPRYGLGSHTVRRR